VPAQSLRLLKLKVTVFQFIQELKIDAPPKRVWAALLDMGTWFHFAPGLSKVKAKVEPWVGGRFYAEDTEDGSSSLRMIITYMEPGRLLRLSGPMGLSHLAATHAFIFELQPRRDGGTLLRFCQRTMGYLTADVAKKYRGGWNQLLPQLKALAEGKRAKR
jgi:uncharacterized protein YndB with AHSA1/START domain